MRSLRSSVPLFVDIVAEWRRFPANDGVVYKTSGVRSRRGTGQEPKSTDILGYLCVPLLRSCTRAIPIAIQAGKPGASPRLVPLPSGVTQVSSHAAP
jgi:hypothetical protein